MIFYDMKTKEIFETYYEGKTNSLKTTISKNKLINMFTGQTDSIGNNHPNSVEF